MTDLESQIRAAAYWRVEVNGKFFAAYSTQQQATQLVAKLRKQGLDAVVVAKGGAA